MHKNKIFKKATAGVLSFLMAAQVMARLGDDNSGSNGATKGQIDCQSDNNLSAAEVENSAWPILKAITPEKPDTDGDGIGLDGPHIPLLPYGFCLGRFALCGDADHILCHLRHLLIVALIYQCDQISDALLVNGFTL